MTAEELPPVLTAGELAAFLRLHPDTVYAMLNRGEFPGAARVGHAWRIPRAAIPAGLRPVVQPSETAKERAARVKAGMARFHAS